MCGSAQGVALGEGVAVGVGVGVGQICAVKVSCWPVVPPVLQDIPGWKTVLFFCDTDRSYSSGGRTHTLKIFTLKVDVPSTSCTS